MHTRAMQRRYLIPSLVSLAAAAIAAFSWWFLRGQTFGVFNPKGIIADQESTLIISAALLMLIVIVPVFILGFTFAWRYRASNTKALYMPEWEHSVMDELVWWAIPFEIILVLGALTWSSTHTLDPHKALVSSVPPLTIEVVALEWKWLFIYPAQGIATVNTLELPVGTPVEFEITADAPMNSFWIPQLGGQMYAMTGMATSLHLMANEAGNYRGGSANYSGDGFAQMQFMTHAVSPAEFDAWVRATQTSSTTLTKTAYDALAQPSDGSALYFGSVEKDLYNTIVMQFMSSTSPSLTGVHQ